MPTSSSSFSGTSVTEEIKARLDIVDVIHEYLQLKQAGANWKANCPFHQEKTPSFMVSRDRQMWHCFGCGEGGDLFTFVQKIEGLEFPEALRLLAKKANVQLPSYNPELQTQKTRVLDALKAAAEFFRARLNDEMGKEARGYLDSRGVTSELIETFQLGYAPDTWDSLSAHLVGRKFSPEDIFNAGLTIKRERGQGYYDRFRARIIFPLRDVHGAVVGFGARAMKKDEQAKYINSPQTMVYDKGGFLYGLDLAKQAIREQKLAVIVEGYMDVIASHRAGVRNVVASSGTALTERQVSLLKRFTSRIALAFDMDLAGTDASQRGIDIALRQELDVRVISLPFGKDPDELIQKDPAAWTMAVAGSLGIMEATFERAFKGKDLSRLEDKKEVVKKILRALTQIPDPLEQAHYIQKLSRLIGVDEQMLLDKLNALTTQKTRPRSEGTSSHEVSSRDQAAILGERVIASLLKYPDELPGRAQGLTETDFDNPQHQALYKALSVAYTAGKSVQRPDDIIQHLDSQDPRIKSEVARLAMLADHEYEELGEEAMRKDIAVSVRRLRLEVCNRKLAQVSQKLTDAERQGNTEEVERLSAMHRDLIAVLSTLSS